MLTSVLRVILGVSSAVAEPRVAVPRVAKPRIAESRVVVCVLTQCSTCNTWCFLTLYYSVSPLSYQLLLSIVTGLGAER